MTLPTELRKFRLAFVDDLARPSLCDPDVTHFRKVLRLEAGEVLNVSDGKGSWRSASLGSDDAELRLIGDIQTLQNRAPRVTVAFAPTKGGRPEWAVQKLSELGVQRIVAIRAHRSVVQWSVERAQKQLLRWQKVAREASMQSRQVYLPVVEPMIDLADFLAVEPTARLCEPGGRPVEGSDSVLVIGPEGGFTDAELSLAANVDLGLPSILRTETAAVVAATALHYVS